MKKPLHIPILLLFLFLLVAGYFVISSGDGTGERARTSNPGPPPAIENTERIEEEVKKRGIQPQLEDQPLPGEPGSTSNSFPAARVSTWHRAAPVSSSETQVTNNRIHSSRLMRWDGETSLVRVEESIKVDPASGERTLVSQKAMLADRVLIRAESGEIPEKLREMANANGFALSLPQSRASPLVEVRLPRATLDAVPDALAKIEDLSLPGVLSEPDYLFFPQNLPDDPLLAKQWGLSRINASGAWEITTGAEEMVVAVIDSGIDLGHPDLAGNLWRNPNETEDGSDRSGNGFIDDVSGWNFVDDNNRPEDKQGHGTHVAGIIGAVGDNALGIAGVNWTTKLLPLGVGRESFTTSRIIAALDYATDLRKNYGVNIVATNNSYGSEAKSELLREAITRSQEAGILFVAAAGNEGFEFREGRLVYPAAYDLDNIITVAATTRSDTLASFSNYGSEYVHMGAPGERIHSTLTKNEYGTKDGTSMAAPYVTGALALMKAANPQLNWHELRSTLLESVDPLPDLEGKTATGGRLNLYRAVRRAIMGPIEVRVQSPRISSVKLPDTASELYLEASLDENGSLVDLPEKEEVVWKKIEGPGNVVFRSFGRGVAAAFQEEGVYILQAFYLGEIAPFGLARKNEPAHQISARLAETGGADGSDTSPSRFHPFNIGGEKIAVHVGGGELLTEGLNGFWKLDESDGGKTPDSSGQHRNALMQGAVPAPGKIGGAFRFDGAGSNISFPAPSLEKITMSAWVNSNSSGNSIFPRILDTPEYILFFGRATVDQLWTDDANAGTVKFYAKKSGSDGVWYSPPGSVGDDDWYHVAVSYDSAEAHSFPSIYINGDAVIVGAQVLPEGDRQRITGPGYIGENGRGDRSWDGIIDEVRIYERVLDPVEIQMLAAEPELFSASSVRVEKENETGTVGVPLSLNGKFSHGEGVSSDVALQWQTLSGPRAVVFDTEYDLQTTARFPETGTYEVALVADNQHARTVSIATVEITGEPADLPVISLDVREPVGLQTPLYPVEITLRSDRPLASDLQIIMDVEGSALPGKDFTLSSDTIFFPAGKDEVSLYVIPRMVGQNGEGTGDRTVTLTVPEGETHRQGHPSQGTITLVEHNYTNWFHRFIQTPIRTDTAPKGSEGNDPNLMKYALGLHPKAPFSSVKETAPSAGVREWDGKTYLTLTFVRPQGIHDVNYIVEGSDDPRDPEGWKSISDLDPVKEIDRRDDGTEEVTVRDSAPIEEKKSRFLRLSVELK